MPRELTIRDLHLDPGEGQPRIRDLFLAEALGFEDRHKIRSLIQKRFAELTQEGGISAVAAENTDPKGRGRPGMEFWLTERQALLVCMWSRAANADAVRQHLATLYTDWRRSRPDYGAAVLIPEVDQLPFLNTQERNRIRFQQGTLIAASKLINDIVAQAMARNARERALWDTEWQHLQAMADRAKASARRMIEGGDEE